MDSEQNLFEDIIRSTVADVSSSDKPVYIIDQSSWDAYIEHYLHERGWGSIDLTRITIGFNI